MYMWGTLVVMAIMVQVLAYKGWYLPLKRGMVSVTQIRWDVAVQPLVYLIELVFSIFWRFTDIPGIAIVGVSIAVNLLCLPLYRMADDVQEREREKQASMERWVSHIKKHFKGDEQYMMLSAYYYEQGYRPIHALA